MLYSCTHMATVAVKGLLATAAAALMMNNFLSRSV